LRKGLAFRIKIVYIAIESLDSRDIAMRRNSLPIIAVALAAVLALACLAGAQWSQTPYDALSIYEAPPPWQDVGSVYMPTKPVMLSNGDFLLMYLAGYYIGATPHQFNYVQRLTPEGQKLWGPEGLPVVPSLSSETDSTQHIGFAISDGDGGAILAWWDTRGTAPDWELYGQRISADGQWLWDSAGVLLATPYTDVTQLSWSMCEDGEGGAYLTWSSEESTLLAGDIYAQRIDGWVARPA
jgi:hypothetical protein